ncbi:hypothetical protein MKX01_011378 [Papaver californicum]|nr:hypothetical protein MKX01_011378 [Papaver californicum]
MVFIRKLEANQKRFTTTAATEDASMKNNDSTEQSTATTSRVFECKTCGKEFSSFQALGGHRASHKKLRLIKGDVSKMDGKLLSSKSSSLHECSICGKGYAIGQALGGHMRRHRNPSKKSPPLSPPSSPSSEQLFSLPLLPHTPLGEEPKLSLPLLPQTPLSEEEPKTLKRKFYAVNNDKRLCLDLNLGPPSSEFYEEIESDDHHQSMPTKPYLGLTLFT